MPSPRVIHTNKTWYAYPDLGSFYRLENGVLLVCPMNKDGSRSRGEEYEVDWGRGLSEEDVPRLQRVIEELARKD